MKKKLGIVLIGLCVLGVVAIRAQAQQESGNAAEGAQAGQLRQEIQSLHQQAEQLRPQLEAAVAKVKELREQMHAIRGKIEAAHKQLESLRAQHRQQHEQMWQEHRARHETPPAP